MYDWQVQLDSNIIKMWVEKSLTFFSIADRYGFTTVWWTQSLRVTKQKKIKTVPKIYFAIKQFCSSDIWLKTWYGSGGVQYTDQIFTMRKQKIQYFFMFIFQLSFEYIFSQLSLQRVQSIVYWSILYNCADFMQYYYTL